MNIIIRPIKENEIPLLTDFLYEAIFLSDTDQIPPRTIIQEPSYWYFFIKKLFNFFTAKKLYSNITIRAKE